MMREAARRSDPMPADAPTFGGTIVKRSVKDLVGAKIESLIASGILRKGDALPGERELAAALNVSRDTVRRAVEHLAGRGILQSSHGTRTRVIRDDVDAVPVGLASAHAIEGYDIEAVHGARLFAEKVVVVEAALSLDTATLDTLAGSIETQRAAGADPVRFLIADREFHFAIYRACSNRLMADFTSDLYAHCMQYRRIAIARPGAIERSIADHVAIEAALRRHDPIASAAAFARHTERIYQTTRQVLGLRPDAEGRLS